MEISYTYRFMLGFKIYCTKFTMDKGRYNGRFIVTWPMFTYHGFDPTISRSHKDGRCRLMNRPGWRGSDLDLLRRLEKQGKKAECDVLYKRMEASSRQVLK